MDSRGFPADLAVVPLFAVGEVLLIGSFQLLHGANVRSEREQRRRGGSLRPKVDLVLLLFDPSRRILAHFRPSGTEQNQFHGSLKTDYSRLNHTGDYSDHGNITQTLCRK